MKIQKDGSLLIADFQEKVGPSYLSDFVNVQCLDVSSVPGIALANTKLALGSPSTASYSNKTFTADAGTDILTPASMVYADFQAVTLTTTGTLPAGLNTSTTYYVFASTATTFKLASTLANAIAGTAIDITSTGSGTHTVVATQINSVKKFVQDTTVTSSNFRFYAIDASARVWVYYSGMWTHLPGNAAGGGQGLEIWKGYLFTLGNNGVVSTYGPLTDVGGTAAWTSSWQDVDDSDAYFAPSVAGQDDILYFAFGRHVYSVEEVSGKTFAPGDATTFSFVNPALDLPSGYRIKTLAELGDRLAIGTWRGPNNAAYSFEDKTADIFFWDRSSDSFDLPVRITDNGVNQLITVDNLLYAVCGYEGRVYVTNGSTAQIFASIPASMLGKQQSPYHLMFLPNAIMRHKGRIFFGVGSTPGAMFGPLGVYSLDISTNKICAENIVSSGNSGTSGNVQIGALLSTGEDDYLCGIFWDSNATFKKWIDDVSTTRYSSDEAFVETGLVSVGSYTDRKTFTNLDIAVAKPMISGTSIKVWYRTTTNGTYTLLGTYSYASYGAFTNLSVSVPIIAVMDLQIKVAVNGDGSSNSPELKSVVIRP